VGIDLLKTGIGKLLQGGRRVVAEDGMGLVRTDLGGTLVGRGRVSYYMPVRCQ